jgi:uncharacterized membrane protein YqjE
MELTKDLGAIIEGFSDLLQQHIRLAKVELKEDAKQLGGQAGRIAAFAPLILIGYALLCVALAFFLRRFLPIDAAFAIVAVLNLAAGGLGIFLAVRRLQDQKVLVHTRDELEATAAAWRTQGQLTAGTEAGR